ncbi:MAG TPA: response regulator [Terriglobales bacterium]|nr:response regulator [Terriglobales bacterium]
MEWSRPPRILVLDDERVIADTLAQILELQGCDSKALYTAADALNSLDEDDHDLLITDVALDPDSINGIDVAVYCHRLCPKCKVLLISGHAASTDMLSAARAQGFNFRLLQKPVHPEDLLKLVCDTLSDLCLPAERIAAT